MENETRELFERLKSTLNTAGEMAKQGLDMAGKKTGEALDAAKSLWRLSELQNEIERLYRDAGRCVYQSRAGGGDDAEHLGQLFEQLDKRLAEMETLRKERKVYRGESPCPNTECAATVQAEDVFCRKCGTPLFEAP